jgi:hypothetical protein
MLQLLPIPYQLTPGDIWTIVTLIGIGGAWMNISVRLKVIEALLTSQTFLTRVEAVALTEASDNVHETINDRLATLESTILGRHKKDSV